MKRMVFVLGLMLTFGAGSLSAAMAPHIYTGTLSGWGGIGDGLLVTAGGDWSRPATTLSWTVDDVTTLGKWHYAYTLTVLRADVQCVIIETSDDIPGPAFTEADLFALSTSPADWFNRVQIGTQSKWDNVNLPDDVYGIKLCALLDPVSLTISFDSDRPPTWGDFYARSFLVDDPVEDYVNTIYNWGFSQNDIDPLDPPRSGSVDNHVLVPDTGTAVPAPAGAALAGMGAVLLGWLRRRGRL
jgi:hypothetical protein